MERQGTEYNKYINAGFVYGTAKDILMMEWVIEYKKNVKYERGLVYDMNKMRKKNENEYVSMTKEEYNEKTNMCKDDQVLLCLYANEFQKKYVIETKHM